MTHPKLHDDGGGLLEVHADVQGLVQVQDVVVGQLLPVLEVDGRRDGGGRGERVLVERGGLVGVLPVPQVLDLLQGYGEGLGEPSAEVAVHAGRDHAVVVGGGDEGLCHELAVEGVGDASSVLLHVGEDLGVLGGLDDDRYGLVVLGRGADHAGPADVDVLDDLLEGDALLEDGLLEGIEVDDHHVDGLDAHGGDGVTSETSVTAMPLSFRILYVPPVETISTPIEASSLEKSTMPVLSDTLMMALLIFDSGTPPR